MKVKELRLVVDTNVLISSFWGGNPGKVIKLWKDGKAILLLTEDIINEYFDVLERLGLEDEEIEEFAVLICDPRRTEILTISQWFSIIKEDEKDNMFLECAFTGKADYIVSGDKHLLELKSFQKIPIISPVKLLKILA